jgi:3-hydroxyacyl-CoA dehydrogenase
VRTDISDEEIVERCMYPAVNEALSALESGSVMRPDDIDVLYVYGYGFPKFRGGIL